MEKVRIAVRKFGPFETTLQKLWDLFCLENNIQAEAEMVPLELNPLVGCFSIELSQVFHLTISFQNAH